MTRTTVQIDGMMCAMCEAHVNDAVRAAFPVKKVTSSHTKGTAVILSDAPLDERALREAIGKTGYRVLSFREESAEKRGLFSFFSR